MTKMRGPAYARPGFTCNQDQIGGLIRQRREELGISQTRLCEGLCSCSTMSRIETGEQMPGFRLLMQILDRLGLPIEFCWSCSNTEEYLTEQIKQRLYRLLELGILEEDPDWLWILEQLAQHDDLAARQYLELLGLLEMIKEKSQMIRARGENFFPGTGTMKAEKTSEAAKQWDKVTVSFDRYHRSKRLAEGEERYGIHQHFLKENNAIDAEQIRFYHRLEQAVLQAMAITRRDFDPMASIPAMGPDRLEIHLLNILGLVYLYGGEGRKAAHLLGGVMTVIKERSRNQVPLRRLLAVAQNNLALCYASRQVYEFALIYVNEAISNMRRDGSALLLARLLRTHMEILRAMGDEEGYQRDRRSIHGICTLLPGRKVDELEEQRIMQRPLGIAIL